MKNDLRHLLNEKWKLAGLKNGDIILVHADIKRTLFELIKTGFNPSPVDIIDSLIDAIGEKGTLLMPAFHFGFSSSGDTFDLKNTVSQMGVMSEVFRKKDGVQRTKHPVYSFSAYGRLKNEFCKYDKKSSYGEKTPFDLLRKESGKILMLDVNDQQSMTFYHHIEEINKVPYRFQKDFTGYYIDEFGKKNKKTYQIYVRNIDLGVETHLHEAEKLLWESQIYKGDRPYVNTGVKTVFADEMFDFVTQNIIKKELASKFLYRTNIIRGSHAGR